jgi:hypothetical protein
MIAQVYSLILKMFNPGDTFNDSTPFALACSRYFQYLSALLCRILFPYLIGINIVATVMAVSLVPQRIQPRRNTIIDRKAQRIPYQNNCSPELATDINKL